MSSVRIFFLPFLMYHFVKHIEKFIFIKVLFVLIENININHKHHQTIKTLNSSQSQSNLMKYPINWNHTNNDNLFNNSELLMWFFIVWHYLDCSESIWMSSETEIYFPLDLLYYQQSKEENMFSCSLNMYIYVTILT